MRRALVADIVVPQTQRRQGGVSGEPLSQTRHALVADLVTTQIQRRQGGVAGEPLSQTRRALVADRVALQIQLRPERGIVLAYSPQQRVVELYHIL